MKNYADVVTIEVSPYGSDCKHHIWLRSLIGGELNMLSIILNDKIICS